MKKYVFLLILTLQFLNSNSQNSRLIENIGVDKGLPGNHVRCITQDTLGFMWIGTISGFARFDGFNFKKYIINSDFDVRSADIRKIICDNNNIIWFITNNKILAFHSETNKFSIFNGSDANIRIKNIVLFRKNYLVVSSDSGLYQIKYDSLESLFGRDVSLEKFNSFKTDESIEAIYSKGNTLWFSVGYKFYSYSTSLTEHKIISDILKKNSHRLSDILIDSGNNIWMASYRNGLYCYDKLMNEVRFLSEKTKQALPSNDITSLCEDNLSRVWVSTVASGISVVRFNKNRKFRINNIRSKGNRKQYISDNDISCLYRDNSGIVWVGTHGNGVDKVTIIPKMFRYIRTVEPNSSWIADHGVSDLQQYNDTTVWVSSGTSGGGVFKINLKNNSTTAFNNYDNQPIYITNLAIRGDLVWLSTSNHNVLCFSISGEKFINRSELSPKIRSLRKVSNIINDRNDQLWIESNNKGFYKYYTENNSLDMPDSYYQVKESKQGNFTGWAACDYEDSKGDLWISVQSKGVFRYNPKSNKVYNYSKSGNNKKNLPDNYVTCITEDNDNNVWIGTRKGLWVYNRKKDKMKRFWHRKSLPSNYIHSILFDKKGYLWVANQNTLSRVNTKTLEVKTYHQEYNLNNCKFNMNSCLKLWNGELLFGTENKGIVRFNPEKSYQKVSSPGVVITGFQIANNPIRMGEKYDNSVVLKTAIEHTKEINLSYKQNIFSFEFVANSHLLQKDIKYRYRLKGFNDKWFVANKNDRVVNYSNIKFGTYHFQIESTNSEGEWTGKITSVTINISPPWYRTYAAYFGFAVLLFSIFFSIWKYTIKQIRLKERIKISELKSAQQKELHSLKLKFFTNISHEFRTPLTILTALISKLKESDNYLSQTERMSKYNVLFRNANNLLRLIDQLMEFRKIDNNKVRIEIQNSSFYDFVFNKFESFRELASLKKIELNLECDKDMVCWFDASKTEIIIHNLVSNAIKYTDEGGSVNVLVVKKDTNIEITVSDNGMGISQEQLENIFKRFYRSDKHSLMEGTGIGLDLTNNLVKVLGGNIEVSSTEGEGSEFKVILPASKEMFKEYSVIEVKNDIVADDEVEDSDIEEIEDPVVFGERPTLAIVEDNVDLRLFLTEIFKDHYNIVTASDGKEGLEKIAVEMPNLVISDIMMPGMNGLEMCKHLKKDVRISHIPVILLTAKTSTEQQIEGIETGADSYITKPFDTEYLKARVKNLIHQRIVLREKFAEKLFDIKVEEQSYNSTDKDFIEKVKHIIEQNMANSDFTMENIYTEIGISRTAFFNKIKALTNQTGADLVRSIRLKKAASLLLETKMNVSEIAYAVGFSDPKYFGKVFKKYFGSSPLVYKKNN